jgi:hypothetical protein
VSFFIACNTQHLASNPVLTGERPLNDAATHLQHLHANPVVALDRGLQHMMGRGSVAGANAKARKGLMASVAGVLRHHSTGNA